MALTNNKLCYYKDGQTYEISLYDSIVDVDNPVALEFNGTTLYAELDYETEINSSDIRIVKNDTIWAVQFETQTLIQSAIYQAYFDDSSTGD